jgi:hypothetical protein
MDEFVDTAGTAGRSIRSIVYNVVLGPSEDDAWAVYRLQADPSDRPAQVERPAAVTVESLAEALDADFSLLRVSRPWSVDDYAIGVEAVADVREVDRGALARYVGAQRVALVGLGAHTVDVLICVRVPADPPRSAREWPLAAEAVIFQNVLKCVRATRVRPPELMRLVRQAFSRGLPASSVLDSVVWESPVRDDRDENRIDAEALYAFDALMAADRGSLRIESDLGVSHQSFLRVEMLTTLLPSADGSVEGFLDAPSAPIASAASGM